ncbi:MAG: bifunctional hydroxymethylpyrimidine kinase/phosphomethylpyrimidine kinase [Ignavibacteriae bacterium]|nr:MAG: bifunctional hydroxymethylpyrimidine kinase/phosphomethylpyrimidine kinase [Ignavibacteriota bacterium]
MAVKFALSIAGSDSSAGAGIQSDLKTFHNHNIYGLTAATSITAQNTKGVQDVFELPAGIIKAQMKSLFDDFDIKAVKTGMLSSSKVIDAVYEILQDKKIKLIIDPVILSKNGYTLLDKRGVEDLKKKLIPYSYLITPNIHELEYISGWTIRDEDDVYIAAKVIYDMGTQNVLVKGGHFTKEMGLSPGTDILFDGKYFNYFETEFVKTKNTHGIGCTLSAAITANLALGKSLFISILAAKKYITDSLKKTRKIGSGYGPVEQ